MVPGTVGVLPSAISRMLLRRILPERVFGSALTMSTWRRLATAPTSSRTRCTSSAQIRAPSSPVPSIPALSTTSPRGTWPLKSSATPMTAHSATSGCPASAASIDPVESRWPATFSTSSVRPMTKT